MNWLHTSGETRQDWLQDVDHREERSSGWYAAAWIEANCVHTTSKWTGLPFKLLPWEVRFLVELLELEDSGRRRHRWAYLSVAKKNGKTELCAAIALWLLVGSGEPSPLIVCAAGNDDQADLVFSAARTMVERSPTLNQVCEVFESEIVVPEVDGRIVRVSASARKHGSNLDGKNILAVLCDELHVWEGSRGRLVHGTLARGTGARDQPLILQLTTAGFDRESICFEQYQRAKDAIKEPDADPHFYAFIVEAPDGCEITPQAFQDANPSFGDIVHADFYADQTRSMPEREVRRYFLNQWVAVEEVGWLADQPQAWGECVGEVDIRPGDAIWVGVDVALMRDTTAVVHCAPKEDGTFHVVSKVWEPEDRKIDHVEVVTYIRSLADRYSVREIVYDPRFFELPALFLEDEGFPMVAMPQSPSRMAPVCANGYDMIVNGAIVHGDDPYLTDHVQSACRREYPDYWTLSKGKSKRHIDACIAMLLAVYRSSAHAGASEPKPPPRLVTI